MMDGAYSTHVFKNYTHNVFRTSERTRTLARPTVGGKELR